MQIKAPSFPIPSENIDAPVALLVLDTQETIFLHSSEEFSLGRGAWPEYNVIFMFLRVQQVSENENPKNWGD